MVTLIDVSTITSTPWKNGGGSTKELFAIRGDKESVDFDFRISMATVSKSGPFSIFPNVDRTLLLISGDGFDLTFPNRKIFTITKFLEPFRFSGDETVDCFVKGESIDFNVMVKRTFGDVTVTVEDFDENVIVIAPPLSSLFIYITNQNQLIFIPENESHLIKIGCKVIKILLSKR